MYCLPWSSCSALRQYCRWALTPSQVHWTAVASLTTSTIVVTTRSRRTWKSGATVPCSAATWDAGRTGPGPPRSDWPWDAADQLASARLRDTARRRAMFRSDLGKRGSPGQTWFTWASVVRSATRVECSARTSASDRCFATISDKHIYTLRGLRYRHNKRCVVRVLAILLCMC